MAILATLAFYVMVGVGLKIGFMITEAASLKAMELPSDIKVRAVKLEAGIKRGFHNMTSSLKVRKTSRQPAPSV